MKLSNSNSEIALVFDDHRLFATAFSMLLERSNLFETVHCFTSQQEVNTFLLQNSSKNLWLFLDFLIPGGDSSQLILNARRMCPTSTIVIVSSLTNQPLIKKMVSYGINGFIGKNEPYTEVTSCIYTLKQHKNTIHFSESVQAIMNQPTENDDDSILFQFTAREVEILRMASQGKGIDEIAERLCITKSTVITHRRNMLHKSGVHSFAKLIALYSQKEWVRANS